MLPSVKIVSLESLELELGELSFVIRDVDIAESLYCVTVRIIRRVTRDNSQTINAVSSDSESVVTKVLAWLTFYQTNPWIFCDIFWSTINHISTWLPFDQNISEIFAGLASDHGAAEDILARGSPRHHLIAWQPHWHASTLLITALNIIIIYNAPSIKPNELFAIAPSDIIFGTVPCLRSHFSWQYRLELGRSSEHSESCSYFYTHVKFDSVIIHLVQWALIPLPCLFLSDLVFIKLHMSPRVPVIPATFKLYLNVECP